MSCDKILVKKLFSAPKIQKAEKVSKELFPLPNC